MIKLALTTLFTILLTASLSGQDKIYNLNFQNATIDEMLKYLEARHGFLFSYKTEDLNDQQFSVSIQTDSPEVLLNELFSSTNLTFRIVEKNYVIITLSETRNNLIPSLPDVQICGSIVDSTTGEALSYANIVIEGTNIGTSADENGKFYLTIKEGTKAYLEISYIGYQAARYNIDQLIHTDCPIIELKYQDYNHLYVVIRDYLTRGISLDNNGLSTILDPGVIGNLPGQADPDILGMVQFLPGISSPTSKPADIYIRGGTPDQNLLMWEDIPIYHSAHYFGMISAFNPFIVDEVKVYRGGFGAAYGGRIAGVIALKAPDEQAKNSNWGLGANMTHIYGYGHQKLSGKRPASLTLSLRRSFSELIRTPTFNNITKVNEQGLLLGTREIVVLPAHITIKDDFNFLDANAKLSIEVTDNDRLELSALYATNFFIDEITDNRRMESQADNMSLTNQGASLKWGHQWTPNLESSVKLISTTFDYVYDYKLTEFNAQKARLSGLKSNMIQDKQFQISTIYKTSNNQEINLGYHLTNYKIEFDVEERSPRSADINDHGSSTANLHSLFIETKNPIQQKLGVNVGVRASYFEINDKVFLEPRIGLSYQLSNTTTVHINYGRHHQFVSQVYEFRGNNNGINTPLWALAQNLTVPVQKADIFQLGSLYKKGGWVIDAQLYKRKIDGLSSRAYEFEMVSPDKPVIGSADIKGFDLLVKKRFQNVGSWISYSYSKADLRFNRIQKATFPSDYDQRHIIEISNQLDLHPFEFAIGFKLSSGLPYSLMNSFNITSKTGELFEYTSGYDGINNYHLNATKEISLSALYNLRFKGNKVKGYFCLSITNALNQSNIYNRSYFVDFPRNGLPGIASLNKSSLPFTPNMSIRFEW